MVTDIESSSNQAQISEQKEAKAEELRTAISRCTRRSGRSGLGRYVYGIFLCLAAWASNVGSGQEDGFNPMEVDIYAGIKPVVGQFTFDLGLIGYVYPIADDPLNYYELEGGRLDRDLQEPHRRCHRLLRAPSTRTT